MYQLSLFSLDEPQAVDPIQILRNGAALVLSVSGGKDSDAMCHHLLECRQVEGWSGDVRLVHADLGRAEWHNTSDYVHSLAQRKDIPLHIVRWTHGDLIDRIWQRYHKDPSRCRFQCNVGMEQVGMRLIWTSECRKIPV